MKNLRSIKDLDLGGKNVFCRLDLNVPMHDGMIADEARIIAALPTIKFLLEKANRVVLASHLGRPDGKSNKKLSLEPVARRLSELTDFEVVLADNYDQEPIDQLLLQLGKKQFVVLENLRFFPGEMNNDAGFSEQLAKGMNCYVDDAFGALHRSHASIVGVPERIGLEFSSCGLLVEHEIEQLSKLGEAKAPYTVIVGGAKVSDKIKVILNLLNNANDLVIGGAMAYTFLRYKGIDVGTSRVEGDKMELVEAIFARAKSRKVNIHLPLDHVCGTDFSADSAPVITRDSSIPAGHMGLDIGPQTRKHFAAVIGRSKTVLWNGPMGVFEWDAFKHGTESVAYALSSCPGYTVVGGGDSVAAINKCGLADQVDHVSTGGGASLKFLEGVQLPGLKILSIQ